MSETNNKHCIDEEFNEIMSKDVRIMISAAFITLEANIKKATKEPLDAEFLNFIEHKANQMKNKISIFINSQVERIINESRLPKEIHSQDSESQEEKQSQ